MSRFCPLFSSSKGNSLYISGGDTSLLIDAGVSYKRLTSALHDRGVEPEQLDGVLVTHEHSDHIQGLHLLVKRLNLPVFASAETLDYLVFHDKVPPGAKLVECANAFTIGDIEVTPFDTPHDAVHSLGFRLEMPDQRKIAVATDLGHITDTVRSHLEGCDLVMLESNYDQRMLECSSYPYILKRRIKSGTGHLSNDDCSFQIASLAKNGTAYFVLGHLSEQNNMPQIAYQVSRSLLDRDGMRADLDYILQVAPARGPGEVLVF